MLRVKLKLEHMPSPSPPCLSPHAQHCACVACGIEDGHGCWLDRIDAPVKVQLGKTAVPLGTVLGLQEGDVLKLDTTLNDDAVVFVGDRPKYLARPGLKGKRRAVQLTDRIVKADESRYMTEVEKTETQKL